MSFVLNYDYKGTIKALSVEKAPFMGDDVLFFPQIDRDTGEIALCISRKPGQGGVDGSGSVAKIYFQIMPGAEEDLLIDLSFKDITASNSSGEMFGLLSRDISVSFGEASEGMSKVPEKYTLSQNYPNPFNPTTGIDYSLPENAHVSIKISNLAGQKVCVLMDQTQSKGHHSISWNGTDNKGMKVSAGIYFYSITAGNFTQTRKMLFMP